MNGRRATRQTYSEERFATQSGNQEGEKHKGGTKMKGLKGLIRSFGLAALVGLSASAMAQISYTFETVNFPTDSFTQLLGINDFGAIAGYHGSGLTGHPNQGFTLDLPKTFTTENFPGSVQTQVIGINNLSGTAGFYIDAKGANHGFLKT